MTELKTNASTNKDRCILASSCKIAGTSACNDHCGSYIAMHGLTGEGGRAGAAGLPADYRLVTLTNSPARQSQARVYALLDRYVATFERQFDEDVERIRSIYLWSESPGTGKTTSASALLNEWLRVHYIGSVKRGLQPTQRPAYFLDVNEFQTEYNLATMTDDEAGMGRIKTIIKRCQSVPFLAMDDIGIRSVSESFKSFVHVIINSRTVKSLPTVFTSNLPLEELEIVFDSRLYDRMRDMCAVIHFQGNSKRGRR